MPQVRVVDRELPRDLDAERSVLGAVLLHGEALVEVRDLLTPQDFFRDAHRRIFNAMLELADLNKPIDLVMLKQQLGRDDVEEVGGPAYIASLIDGVPRSTNIVHYADIIKEKASLRSIIYAANKLVTRAYDAEDDVVDIIGRATEELTSFSGPRGGAVHVSAVVAGSMALIQTAAEKGNGLIGLTSGLKDLDDMLAGLQPSDLIVVAARPGGGKTSLGINMARRCGQPALAFSLEMSREQLFVRMLATEARIDSNRVRTGRLSDHEWTKLSKAVTTISELPIHIDDTPAMTVLEIRARARAHAAVYGLKLVVVDYLQLLRGSGKFENRTQEVGTISRGLKAMAKELHVPVVAMAQLRRARADGHARPQLSDLRESGDIESDADVVLLIWKPDEIDDPNVAEIIVAKQRNGPTGDVKVAWLPWCTSFENLERGAA